MATVQATKAEKRADGIWYYLCHYPVCCNPQFYKGKVEEVQDSNSGDSSLPQGWNKKWDEWVEAPGLVKYDPKLVDGGESKDEEGGGKKKSQPGKRPEKRRKLNDIGAPDAELPGEDAEPAVRGLAPEPVLPICFQLRGMHADCELCVTQIQVQLPASLKQLLLDGHQAFSKGQKLPRLPHSPTVGDILQRYLEERTGEKQLIDPREEVRLTGSNFIQPRGALLHHVFVPSIAFAICTGCDWAACLL